MFGNELEIRLGVKSAELYKRLMDKGLTFATAESCTAGMISAAMGDVPGVSEVFLGGVVSYANEVKINVLGVPEEVIKTVGAVSEKCAGYMAEGSKRVTGADVAVSVTGIAGPGGGTKEKPVGTVCFGFADKKGTYTETVHFGENLSRSEIRYMTAVHALELVYDRIKYYRNKKR